MSVISREYIKDVAGSSATYVIQIKDFQKMLDVSRVGSKTSTHEFYVNWSKFNIDLFIAGAKNYEDFICVFLTNHSDWMVRAVTRVYVKTVIILASGQGGDVFLSKDANVSKKSLGWLQGVPHSRCLIRDLLSEDGSLTMEVKVELLGENIPGGGNRNREIQELKKQMTKEMKEMSKQMSKHITKEVAGLKHKLDNQEAELLSVKTKLRKVETNLQDVNRDGQQPPTVKCPMCSKVVARPMRLLQCPQVRHFLLVPGYLYNLVNDLGSHHMRGLLWPSPQNQERKEEGSLRNLQGKKVLWEAGRTGTSSGTPG